ncbi:hypothetical protein BKA69DRAFT_1104037 [Paraphysoderma sedebokerense]|nr:hypothetical protein BKA69DRAFT_1104037 [Paraphysoderma sedebokerense]
MSNNPQPASRPSHPPPATKSSFSNPFTFQKSVMKSFSVTSNASLSSPSPGTGSTNVFLVMALEKITQHRDTKKLPKLKEAATSALDTLKKINDNVDANAPSPVIGAHTLRGIFHPFQLACQSKSPALMVIALDCLAKLISYNCLADGKVSGSSSLKDEEGDIDKTATTTTSPESDDRPIIDIAVETICNCFVGETTDENVQLQIVKALLAAASSTAVPIHGGILLRAVRTTYNIFLLSKSPNIQTVAQGTLTQMIHIVFGRVYSESAPSSTVRRQHLTTISQIAKDIHVPIKQQADPEKSPNQLTPQPQQSPTDDMKEKPNSETSGSKPESPSKSPKTSAAEEIMNKEDESDEKEDLSKSAETTTPSGTEANGPSDSKNEDATSANGVPGEAEESRKSSESASRPTLSRRNSQESTNEHYDSQLPDTESDLFLRDAFLVFRALCKLSMKVIPGESTADLKSPAMRSRILSLHLILIVVSSHLPIFSKSCPSLFPPAEQQDSLNITFTDAVKQYLVLSISRCAVSPVPAVFEPALDIFARVVLHMRSSLKKELEVIFNDIVLSVLEMKNSTFQQKFGYLNGLAKILSNPQCVVDIYLNYDCDKEALDNIYEKLVNIISRITSVPSNQYAGDTSTSTMSTTASSSSSSTNNSIAIPPALTTASVAPVNTSQSGFNPDQALKGKSLECLVAVLRSLAQWCKQTMKDDNPDIIGPDAMNSSDTRSQIGEDETTSNPDSSSNAGNGVEKVARVDDPEHFENMKYRKTVLQEGIKKFNFKPKKGMQYLIDSGMIPSKHPVEIAKFLLTTDGLNKAAIGEYLGEGDPENITIMHAFVDLMDFTDMAFVAALRTFLQAFRLPGEAQKIDRFMLKFAERFVRGNAEAFANADTAYVLAYSVIMLNTDLHNPQVKKRMTKPEFLKNNRGINDNKNLPDEFLGAIYDDILNNEIKLKDDPLGSVGGAGSAGAGGAGVAVAEKRTKKQKKEAFNLALEEIATKVESQFKTLAKSKKNKNTSFYAASHHEHVRSMFELVWMAVLAGISAPLQESEDLGTINLCLEGFKHAIRITSIFDLELERNAFVTTLSKFTFLNNLGEMKAKNIETIKTLLDIAFTEGNYLKNSWLEVLTCISQLERFQLISGGLEEERVPDLVLGKKQGANNSPAPSAANSLHRRVSNAKTEKKGGLPSVFTEAAALASTSQNIVVAVDKIFTNSTKLSGNAIIDFVRCLCVISWDEIQSSSHVENPRMFCLQKLVEISYYNMNRIRMEWSNIWAILGEHFNQVGCHQNNNVAFFALDSLRQLSMKFLEKDELANFKFQREFLKPFEYVLANNPSVAVKDMVLRCLQQMIQARAKVIKSGWKTMCGVFAKAGNEPHESIIVFAFDIMRNIFKFHLQAIVANNTYSDFISCMVQFVRNKSFPKTSLQAVEHLKGAIPVVADVIEKEKVVIQQHTDELSQPPEDPTQKYWLPTLTGLHEIVMTCDLESRTRALTYLFDALKQYGKTWPKDFWDIAAKTVLFPIFDDLKVTRKDHKFMNKDDYSEWLNTTLIQALRQLVDLFTYYFDTLSFLMDKLLELLKVCIIQENETLARLGTTCLQQLIENNANKVNEESWDVLCAAFGDLFEATTAYALFEGTGDPAILKKIREQQQLIANQLGDTNPLGHEEFNESTSQASVNASAASTETRTDMAESGSRNRQAGFQQIIVKCVLQLLLIQTLNELLNQNENVYQNLMSKHLFMLIDCLDRSYEFARSFNSDLELRTSLWKAGFTKQLPNLLKQETTSVACYIDILVKMYLDTSADRSVVHNEVETRLIPLSLRILSQYNNMDSDSKRRNLTAWRPVVISILNGIAGFDDDAVRFVISSHFFTHSGGTLNANLDM